MNLRSLEVKKRSKKISYRTQRAPQSRLNCPWAKLMQFAVAADAVKDTQNPSNLIATNASRIGELSMNNDK